jgi:amino acid transporter
MSLQEFGYKEQLNRALTTRDLVIYGMIFMVPIAPFAVFGFVWNEAKGMVPLAYLVGLAGMFFTALSYAAMSRAFPLAGSPPIWLAGCALPLRIRPFTKSRNERAERGCGWSRF